MLDTMVTDAQLLVVLPFGIRRSVNVGEQTASA